MEKKGDLRDPAAALECTYALTVGVDYNQPTSLDGDLQELADALAELEIFNSTPPPSELLDMLQDVREELGDTSELCEALESVLEVIASIDYGTITEEMVGKLEDALPKFASEMESFLNELV